jgi:hypothetical protein
MKQTIYSLAISFILIGSISCKKEPDVVYDDPNVYFSADINGSQEAPTPNASTATGSALATFNKNSKVLTIVVNHSIPSPINGHIHKGARGVAGGVIFPFSTFVSPINYTTVALTAAQEADLMGNLYYVNIHTTAFPAGEIRGQLTKQ